MLHVNHIVNQGKIDIINRNAYLTSHPGCHLKFFYIDNLVQENARDGLFQNIINRFLQIRIQGKIYISAGYRINPPFRLDFLS